MRGLDEYQDQGSEPDIGLLKSRRLQMRFYFEIRDRLVIRDEVGRDLKSVSEAVVYAKYLAADLRCLESDARPSLSIQVIGAGDKPIHEEVVFA
jgi:hypothetical protein